MRVGVPGAMRVPVSPRTVLKVRDGVVLPMGGMMQTPRLVGGTRIESKLVKVRVGLPDAVAAWVMVRELVEAMASTWVSAGMPVPVTNMPTWTEANPAEEVTVCELSVVTDATV